MAPYISLTQVQSGTEDIFPKLWQRDLMMEGNLCSHVEIILVLDQVKFIVKEDSLKFKTWDA